jgi:hypothetical protein
VISIHRPQIRLRLWEHLTGLGLLAVTFAIFLPRLRGHDADALHKAMRNYTWWSLALVVVGVQLAFWCCLVPLLRHSRRRSHEDRKFSKGKGA